MTQPDRNRDNDDRKVGVNPGYAAFQIAKALTTSTEHGDPATRARAREKIGKWETVLSNILAGSVEYGSRTPVEGVPAWATLEVVTGGFATGELLAGGPLQEHERKLFENLPPVPEGQERRALNAHFLTDAGLATLRDWLATGHYDVAVPEEGALMVVAWLAENGYAEDARALLDQLSPYLSRLRFYPIPLEQPRHFGPHVHLQDVGATIRDLQRIKPNQHILAQKEAVEIWAPFYDRVVALFLETVEDGWPCRKYPADWSERARALQQEYQELRKEHALCGKFERPNEHRSQLLGFLGQCAASPRSLTGREVSRIRVILNRYVAKRGAPDSATCAEARRRQRADVRAPTYHAISEVIIPRLEAHPKEEGLDDVGPLEEAITLEEAAKTGVPAGTLVPPAIQRKIERCLNDSVDTLVKRGLITSGEVLARVLPQMTSGLRAAGIEDPKLGQLYAAIYRAFRRRRSLLLLNLEKQVQIHELPWVAAIDRFRSESISSRELARQTLEQVSVLTLTAFPHMLVPNKLLQELRALVKQAELDLPLVDELAADILMGRFSDKFLASAQLAAGLLDGTLYATYYGIDYRQVRGIARTQEVLKRLRFWEKPKYAPDTFGQLCMSRAGVARLAWDPATNGMVIEQQQILTTQNLAALFVGLSLTGPLHRMLDEMAKQCFRWVCRRHQMKIDRPHARLIMLKNTAYAWRQMIFFLALLSEREVADFLGWAQDYLDKQSESFRHRFHPALDGLVLAAHGRPIESEPAGALAARRFLGWSKAKHWLLTEVPHP